MLSSLGHFFRSAGHRSGVSLSPPSKHTKPHIHLTILYSIPSCSTMSLMFAFSRSRNMATDPSQSCALEADSYCFHETCALPLYDPHIGDPCSKSTSSQLIEIIPVFC